MQAYLTLARREFTGFFFSISGYVIIAAAAFLMGLGFVSLLANLQGDPTPMPVTELFYMTLYFWVILLLTIPVITMRLFAQEKASGTFETLMTTPVTDLQMVASRLRLRFSVRRLFPIRPSSNVSSERPKRRRN